MEEIWKDIEGYEGLYQVSNLGKVVSLRFNPPKEIYQTLTNCGYKQVQLYNNGKKKQIGVHVLVAKAFVDGYKDGLEVNHKDLNKINNTYFNLEWVTRSENQQHQFKAHGKKRKQKYCADCGAPISQKSNRCNKCRGIFNRKYDMPEREELKLLLKQGNFWEVSKIFGASDNTIRKWCKKYNLPFYSKVIRNTTDYGWANEIWDDKPEPIKNSPQEKKPIYMIDKNTNKILKEFESILSAAVFLNHKEYANHISDVCNHKRIVAYGYKWKFKKDIDTEVNL